MLEPITMTQVTHELVEEKWGVPPVQLGDVLALTGDAADNIPGVPGIGPKIAAKLISEFGSLDELLARSDEVPQTKRRENLQVHAEQAKLSQSLFRLEHEIPLDRLEVDPPKADTDTSSIPITEWRIEPMDADRILAFYDEMGFVTIKQRLLDRLKEQTVVQFQSP
jgi:DNA polymerase-1